MIYALNYPAEDAIKTFKSKRTGKSLSSSGQKKTIRKFHTCRPYFNSLGLAQMRRVYMPQPAYTLTQYMTIQLQIREVIDNEVIRRTPFMMQIVLRNLEALIESNHTSKIKILCSFFDLDNNQVFDTPWTEAKDKRLELAKTEINDGTYDVRKETDTRVMAQLMLDFFENLKDQAISLLTVNHLSKQVQTGMSSQEILHDHLDGGYTVPRDPSKVDSSKHRKSANSSWWCWRGSKTSCKAFCL